jgi:hypothetical protein
VGSHAVGFAQRRLQFRGPAFCFLVECAEVRRDHGDGAAIKTLISVTLISATKTLIPVIRTLIFTR